MIDRRALLGGAMAASASGLASASGPINIGGTRLVLLGVKGGPTPSLKASEPASAVIVDGVPYLVDCGYGVVLQMLKVGISAEQLAAIFITHHHFDHNADLGTVFMTAWQRGLAHPISVVGPPPIADMVDAYLRFSQPDLAVRMEEEGREPLRPLLDIREVGEARVVHKDARVQVSTAIVDHWLVKPALAYRFDTRDRSIVFSGDTAFSNNLISLAHNADVLVHESLYLPAVRSAGQVPGAPNMREHVVRSHTQIEDVGRVAAMANVGTLVLNHFVPYDAGVSEQIWLQGARKHFGGRIIVGRELMVI